MAQGVANMVARCSAASRPPAPSRAPSPTCAPAPPARWRAWCRPTPAASSCWRPRRWRQRPAGGAGRHPAGRGLEHGRVARVRAPAPLQPAYRTIMLGTFFLTVVSRPHGGGGSRPDAGLPCSSHLPHEHRCSASSRPPGRRAEGVPPVEIRALFWRASSARQKARGAAGAAARRHAHAGAGPAPPDLDGHLGLEALEQLRRVLAKRHHAAPGRGERAAALADGARRLRWRISAKRPEPARWPKRSALPGRPGRDRSARARAGTRRPARRSAPSASRARSHRAGRWPARCAAPAAPRRRR